MEEIIIEKTLQRLVALVAVTFNLSTLDAVGVVAGSDIANKIMNRQISSDDYQTVSQQLIEEVKLCA